MHSFQVMHLFDASKRETDQKRKRARGGGETKREGREKTKETQRDRQKATQGREKQISHSHVLLMCGNVQERGFINIVDSRRRREHKEHFALQAFIKKSHAYSKHILYNTIYVRFSI